jgi:hypothetical protein
VSANVQWNTGYERIGICAKHADAVQERKPGRKPRKNLRQKRDRLSDLITIWAVVFADFWRLVPRTRFMGLP